MIDGHFTLRPMKVLHLISTLAVGGAEVMLYKLLRGMNREKFQLVVVNMTSKGTIGQNIQDLGIPVHELKMPHGIPSPLGLLKLMHILRLERPTILQTWLYHADLLGLIAGKLMRIPNILWNIRCSTLERKDYAWHLWLTLKILSYLSSYPRTIVTNSEAGRLANEKLGYQPKEWVVIPNGFDLNILKPSEEARKEIRRELDLSSDTILIGLIARWDPMKDHATFLEAARKLLQTHPSVHFVLVGKKIDDGNPELMEKITSLALKETVHLLGERKDIASITAALDIATCSSYSEGFPNIIGEAMACAVPCVTTDIGDCEQIVGDSGIIVRSRDPIALANGWSRLLLLSSDERRSLGLKGRNRVSEFFDITKVVQLYETLYERLALEGT